MYHFIDENNCYNDIKIVDENEKINEMFCNKTNEQIVIFDFDKLQQFIDCFYENEFEKFFECDKNDFIIEFEHLNFNFCNSMKNYDKKIIENEFYKIKQKYKNFNNIECVFENNCCNISSYLNLYVIYCKNDCKNVFIDEYVIMYNINEFKIECDATKTFDSQNDALSYIFNYDHLFYNEHDYLCNNVNYFEINYIDDIINIEYFLNEIYYNIYN